METQEIAGSISKINIQSDSWLVPRIEAAVLWLPEKKLGLSVVRSFERVRTIGKARQLHDFGSCACCSGRLKYKPYDGGGYGNKPQSVVTNAFSRPNTEVSSPEDLEHKLLAAAKPAELMVWTEIGFSNHKECYEEEGEPFGQAIKRSPAVTKNHQRNVDKAIEVIVGDGWLASASILVIRQSSEAD